VGRIREVETIPRVRRSSEQIINMLREAVVLQAQGMSIREVSKELGITDQTYYRWRKEYGGLRVDQAKRLKDLEKENSRLKRVVAELTLDAAILKEAASRNF
jgi:transposase-like protein